MMTPHRRAPGEPPAPPAEDTHHTVGITAVSKVGTEPSHFPSWKMVTSVLQGLVTLFLLWKYAWVLEGLC